MLTKLRINPRTAKNIFLLKTIVPESCLFEDQLDTYDRFVDHYHDFLYTVYPEKIADYITDSELDYFRPLPEAGAPVIFLTHEELLKLYNYEVPKSGEKVTLKAMDKALGKISQHFAQSR